MDEVLRVFLAETSRSLNQCEAGLDPLHESSHERALGNLLELLGSVREMSIVLGIPQLHAAAADGIGTLEELRRGGAGTARIGLMASNCLAQLRALIGSLEQAHDEPPSSAPALLIPDADSSPSATARAEPARAHGGEAAVLVLEQSKPHETAIDDELIVPIASPQSSKSAGNAPAADRQQGLALSMQPQFGRGELLPDQAPDVARAADAAPPAIDPLPLMPTANAGSSSDLDIRVDYQLPLSDQRKPSLHRRSILYPVLLAISGALSVAAAAGGTVLWMSDAKPDADMLAGVPEVVDTGTLKIEDRWVHLEGVHGVTGAPVRAMAKYIGGRTAVCRLTAANRYRCEIDGWDLSEAILYNGGGRATASAPSDLLEAERKAREAKRGIWAAGKET